MEKLEKAIGGCEIRQVMMLSRDKKKFYSITAIDSKVCGQAIILGAQGQPKAGSLVDVSLKKAAFTPIASCKSDEADNFMNLVVDANKNGSDAYKVISLRRMLSLESKVAHLIDTGLIVEESLIIDMGLTTATKTTLTIRRPDDEWSEPAVIFFNKVDVAIHFSVEGDAAKSKGLDTSAVPLDTPIERDDTLFKKRLQSEKWGSW